MPLAVPADMPLYRRLKPFEGDGSAWPVYKEQPGTANVNRFNNRSHGEGETLGQFIAALRGLASACAFGNQLYSLLRDRFELPGPSLDDVVKAAQAIDAAAKDAGEIARATGSPSTEATDNKMTTKGGTASSPKHNASRAEKLGTSHGFAEGGGRTADSSSSLDQAQVPHKPAVRVAVASVRDGDVRQQARASGVMLRSYSGQLSQVPRGRPRSASALVTGRQPFPSFNQGLVTDTAGPKLDSRTRRSVAGVPRGRPTCG
ncbi:hypothetical protein HPB49_013889 [Dermacentor silvarum]|uniref:Uncharacterized protein n=1 Tax=Dermacentor silvarum TaxID=543639 RepID=A0ACB8E1K5_DERSI|nr:hypothetical protein HPB49_013889 [Dermacentor silvarum]